MSRVVIVGAGLFGSIIGAHLRAQGHEVRLVSDQREGMGSLPAACLMKPSWASGMGKEYDRAIDLLAKLYTVHTLEFDTPPFRAIVTAHWVDPAVVLAGDNNYRHARVMDWGKGWVELGNAITGERGDTLYADHIIFATGQWAEEMDAALRGRLTGKGGWSFLLEGELQGRGLIHPWAPYRQLVAFQIAPRRIWVGDGAALKAESMTFERQQASQKRCLDALNGRLRPLGSRQLEVRRGFRPYVKGLDKPAYINQVSPGVTVVTGGAKNGTLGAAWAARQIAEQLA